MGVSYRLCSGKQHSVKGNEEKSLALRWSFSDKRKVTSWSKERTKTGGRQSPGDLIASLKTEEGPDVSTVWNGNLEEKVGRAK